MDEPLVKFWVMYIIKINNRRVMIRLVNPAMPKRTIGRARKRENAVLLRSLSGGTLLTRIIPEG